MRKAAPVPEDLAGALAGAVAAWPGAGAAGVVSRNGVEATAGRTERSFPWASVTKLLVALSCLVAWEEGTVDLDDPVGPPGSTLGHLLAHASGLPFEGGQPVAPPGRRRIYSNSGIERAAEHLEARSGMHFGDYLQVGVLSPLSATTWQVATSVAWPGLSGVLPGYGRQDPCDWGLGPEIRGHKSPHWTGARNSPSTFGHFGQSGSLLWVDPDAGVALAGLSGENFGPWAKASWPALSDVVVAYATSRDRTGPA